MATPQDDLRTTMQATLKGFLEDYRLSVQKQDASYLSAKLTADCTRHLAPASFPAAFTFIKPSETNGEYEARMQGEVALMQEVNHKILSLVVDPVERKGTAHAEHWTKFRDAAAAAAAGGDGAGEEMTLEICWIVDFAADGTAISRITEFIDTAAAAKMVQAIVKKSQEGGVEVPFRLDG
ncbi:hypothetical protein UCREL1_4703 [Eutypa lata UCREL1]|uniref:Uncharacterized protein n=1 Tax=Eutypa lata (strain UCR-EL1) TaxID=1287681 RepID=M7SVH9_EUTLA|nr:hypothetical protein UCREL1_4703 [Eutypa lata UCREL1]